MTLKIEKVESKKVFICVLISLNLQSVSQTQLSGLLSPNLKIWYCKF